MYLPITYEPDFDDLWMYLKGKYPDKIFDLDGVGEQLDLCKFSKNFFNSNVTADVSIDANANVDDISVIAYVKELPKPFFRLNSYYMLWKELRRLYGRETANKIVKKQLCGDIYINDFHGLGSGLPYCYNYSTYDIMTKGLPMINKIKSTPPKNLFSFKSQVEQFVIIASNSTLGATGLADMLIVMSYYVKKLLEDKEDSHFKFKNKEDCWIYVKETLTSFIYTINQPMRANQSPFTNISIYDTPFLDKLVDDYIFPDGTNPDKDIVKELQRIILEIINEELQRTPLTFPIITACFAVNGNGNGGKLQDEEFAKLIAHYNKNYGFINIYCGKTSQLSSCCRLRSDTNNEYFNSFGSGSSKIGSLGVVTINMPRLAIKYKYDEDKFFSKLREYVKICSQVNNAKRHLVQKRIDNGNHPLYTLEFTDIKTQYSTVGINGLNECLEILGYDILSDKGQGVALDIMNAINSENDKYQKQYDSPHNCEQVPGENLSIKLAEKDKLLKYQNTYDIYSNQFIPLTTNADMLDRIEIQGKFDKHFSGGAICHINVDEKIEDESLIVNLIKECANKGVIYFAINYNLQKCEDSHMSVGKKDKCSICGKPIIENYTRVVGFLTSTKNWHKTRRKQDYPNRVWYDGVDK